MLALLVAAAISSPTGSIDPKARAVLDAAKLAAGGAAVDALGPYELDERIRWHGLTGTEVTLCDPKMGAYSHRVDLGLHSGGDGFDGKHVWTSDSTGDTRQVDDIANHESAVHYSYLCAFGYWYPDRMPPATIKFEGTNDLDGRAVDQLTVDLGDHDSLVLSFDHQSDRLVSISSIPFAVTSSTTTFYSDFRSGAGVSLPFHRMSKSTSFGSFETDGDVRSFADDPGISSKLAFVNRTPDDSSIEGGKTSESLPFELSNGLIYLKVKLNGHGPFRFLLDSGRTDRISATVAARLHLKDEFGKEISTKLQGSTRRMSSPSIEVGAATLRAQPVVVDSNALSYYYAGYDGGSIDGILGYEFLRRFVITLDFRTRTMTLSEPARFKADAKAHAVPFVFDGVVPRIAATVDGKAGDFAINTNLQYSFVTSFVWNEHNEPAEFDRVLKDPGYLFIFGPRLSEVEGSLKRVKSVTIGGISVRAPVIICSGPSDGGWASTEFDTAGDIGLGLLNRFVVTFDYQKQILWLTPTPLAASPEVFDRSGILLTQGAPHGDGLQVIRGSPAERAGIKSGESVIAIDGKPIASWGIDSLHRLLTEPVGTKVTLQIGTMKLNRVVRTRTVTIVLSDYI